jgi:hypothetical protein
MGIVEDVGKRDANGFTGSGHSIYLPMASAQLHFSVRGVGFVVLFRLKMLKRVCEQVFRELDFYL